jgi:NADH-ubiquinone oxidoreductase chain 4
MILIYLLLIPIIGILLISSDIYNESNNIKVYYYKSVAFITSIINLIVSLMIYMLFDFSTNQFQFVEENYNLSYFDVYLGLDGVSIYFVLLTTIIIPIALLSN